MDSEKREDADSLVLFIVKEIRKFAATSPLNRLPELESEPIFDEPLVQFADGDDPIFAEYKKIIDPAHLTPREALAKAYDKSPDDLPHCVSVISWILPITGKTRESNRTQKDIPSRPWAHTRWYGEKFNDALRAHLVKIITEKGYLAVTPALQPYFVTMSNERGRYSNWSERHIAYAAGLGTFSLSDGFITERGIAHRCGSVVTDMPLPVSPRTARSPYANCLFYVNNRCHACVPRCPVGAITEQGHDKVRCHEYLFAETVYLKDEYGVEVWGCGLCQTRVPCEFRNPAGKQRT
jgi:epoxyqueuosine reductase